MSQYEISVVTPFHNVDPEMFRKASESIKEQTIGFEKIEWIVVFHNCEQKYIDAALEILGEHENIKTEILNNEIRTPSSPRNHGMKMATAKYLGFLDGDDSYTRDCFENALDHMKRSGAQITWFRREYELETENNVPITEIVLWDQTQEEIIIDKDVNWDNEKLFSGVWALVTSRIYDREFLLENDIWFDEKVNFAEDYTFNLEAYGHVKRLCYLPQTIGYHYFINSGSLVQKGEKDAETLITMAGGFARLFETGLKYGFYMDPTMGGMFFSIMRFMMGSRSLTLEDRNKIKDILAPYLDRMRPIKVSKLYSEKAAYERSYKAKDYLLNPEKWANTNGSEILIPDMDPSIKLPPNMALLREILEDNSQTDIGNRYNFNDVVTISGYQSMVPPSNYEAYKPLIALTTRIGESGIFTKDPIAGYMCSPDVNGQVRILPATKKHLDTYVDHIADICRGEITLPLFEGLETRHRYNDNTYARSINAAIFEHYANKVKDSDDSGKFVMPLGAQNGEEEDGYYLRALYALSDPDITQLLAQNMFSVNRFIQFIIHNRAALCNDIENGTISGTDESKETTERTFTIRKNPERAAFLREILSDPRHFGLKKIWNNIRYITAYDGGEYRFYSRILSPVLLGIRTRSLDIRDEAMLGFSSDTSESFVLNTAGAFLEFVKAGEDTKQTDYLLPKDLKTGETYRVFVTNRSGLYRYDMETMITVTANEKDRIEYLHADVVKDGISESVLCKAVIDTIYECGIHFTDYACDVTGDHYTLYLERIADNSIGDPEIEKAAVIFEDTLNDICDEYRSARQSGKLNKAEIRVLSPESMMLFAEIWAKRFNVSVDLVKPLRLVDKKEHIEFLKKMSEVE